MGLRQISPHKSVSCTSERLAVRYISKILGNKVPIFSPSAVGGPEVRRDQARSEPDANSRRCTDRRRWTDKAVVHTGTVSDGIGGYAGRCNSRRIAEDTKGPILRIEGVGDKNENFDVLGQLIGGAKVYRGEAGQGFHLVGLVAAEILVAFKDDRTAEGSSHGRPGSCGPRHGQGVAKERTALLGAKSIRSAIPRYSKWWNTAIAPPEGSRQ